jgi:hypothetical protein
MQLKNELRCFSKCLIEELREKSFRFLTVQFTELSCFCSLEFTLYGGDEEFKIKDEEGKGKK